MFVIISDDDRPAGIVTELDLGAINLALSDFYDEEITDATITTADYNSAVGSATVSGHVTEFTIFATSLYKKQDDIEPTHLLLGDQAKSSYKKAQNNRENPVERVIADSESEGYDFDVVTINSGKIIDTIERVIGWSEYSPISESEFNIFSTHIKQKK